MLGFFQSYWKSEGDSHRINLEKVYLQLNSDKIHFLVFFMKKR
jgi:hypothetical protein